MSSNSVVTVTEVSLRDWFAATIDMQKIDIASISNGNKIAGYEIPNSDDLFGQLKWQCDIESRVRYMKADAMLKAREAQP